MKRLLPWVAMACWLAGCTSPADSMRAGQAGAVATIKVYVPSPAESAAGNEVRCQIQLIDGAAVESSDNLSPGKHRLIVSLHSEGKEYVGDVDLIIPEAKNYRLKAERKEDFFTLSLVEVTTGKSVAASTAPAEQQMKFLVFVIQK